MVGVGMERRTARVSYLATAICVTTVVPHLGIYPEERIMDVDRDTPAGTFLEVF